MMLNNSSDSNLPPPVPAVPTIPSPATGGRPHKFYKTTPCRHFARGECKLGANCNFRHGEDDENATQPMFQKSVPPTSLVRTRPCRHFQRGYCERGDQCNFLHVKNDTMSLQASVMIPPAAFPGPPLAGTGVPWTPMNSITSGNFTEGKSPPIKRTSFLKNNFVNMQVPNLVRQTVVCRHKLRGYCERGDSCNFLHPPDLPPVLPNQLTPGMQAPTTNMLGNSRICRHFMRGFCERGDSCGFLHIEDESAGLAPPFLFQQQHPGIVHIGGSKPCRHFLRGRCDLGPVCKFAHDPALFGTQRDTDTAEKRGTRPCRHFAKGNCILGDSCQFAHGPIKTPGGSMIASTQLAKKRKLPSDFEDVKTGKKTRSAVASISF